ncbi:hypothetical protein [Roseicyclus mahoneyensis]|uniref:Uncharacterized protein n=1 Tax=Roseicyclus mahoneyensis TaxID=164332 RepID=A0A316GHC8_9RHOB|nr:hypothetical protein [Roseicyclus mahoneyensis]PWK60256.1 hypothetical protein C7455_105241 [Roseicyclus mahoneyensis]
MFHTLRTTLSAAALSALLAVGAIGASTAPAQADSRDAAAVIAGIIALYAIGRAIDDRGDRRPPSQLHHVPAHPRQIVAPAQCYREFQTRDGFFRGYAGHCLQRSTHVALPQACARDYRTDRGWRTFYGGRCLSQYGWVREGHRSH